MWLLLPDWSHCQVRLNLALVGKLSSSFEPCLNKKIQVDTNDKLRVLGSKMFALTLHAFGKSCIEKYLGRESDVDDDK